MQKTIDGVVEDCGISFANAVELPPPCAKPS